MAVTAVSKDSFKQDVVDYRGIILVDFFAEWCGPCKTTGPIIDKLSEEIKEVKFVKVNVDENPDLVSQYSIFSIPTFVIFKNGKIVSQFVGAQSKEGFLQEINKSIREE